MKLKPTSEQTAILESVASGKNIAIKALAGTGKTSTLQMLAQQDDVQTLYVCFNKSIAEEAESKFPKHVTCKTLHSLAFAKFGSQFKRGKESLILSYYDTSLVREILGDSLPDNDEHANRMVSFTVDIVKGFCNSNATTLEHYVEQEVSEEHQCFGRDAKTLWDNISNPRKALFSTHDVYLKLWALSKPQLGYARIMLDEAQDTNPVCLGVFLGQTNSQLIAVGDECQSIYGFRGAKNFFSSIPKDWDSLALTESFRFGPGIARQANMILRNFGTEVIGKAKDYEGETFNQVTYLVRNNSTLMSILLQVSDDKKKAYVYADMRDTFKKMYHIEELLMASYKGRKPSVKYPDKQLSQFRNWEELEASGDSEVQKFVKLTRKCIPVHGTVTKLKACLVSQESQADIVISTGHKAKGREWDDVILTDDFLPDASQVDWENMSDKDRWQFLVESQSLQLLYVAMTRAKVRLSYSREVATFLEVLRDFKRMFDKAQGQGQ